MSRTSIGLRMGGGLAAAAVALGVAQLLAVFFSPAADARTAVGTAVINVMPGPVKEWAIQTFPNSDKLLPSVMVIVVTGALVAAAAIWERSRVPVGSLAILAGAVAGSAAVLAQPEARSIDVIPTLLGAACGIVVLRLLTSSQHREGFATASTEVAGVDPSRRLSLVALGFAGIGLLGVRPQDLTGATAGVVHQGELVVNVKDYRAVGDGITDDTDAINAAITAASSSGGGTVILPAGFNFLVTTLVPLSNVTIMGYGATLTKNSSGTKEIITNRGDFAPFSNFKVYGVTFIGEGQSFGDISLTTNERRGAVGFYYGTNVTVQDCYASDFAFSGFGFVNCIGVRIVNNKLTNCVYYGLGNAIHVRYAGVNPSAPFDTVITGNTVTGCQTAACCIQGSYANPGNFPYLTHVHHNNFTCSSFAAIAIEIGNEGAPTTDTTIRRVVIDHNFCTQTAPVGTGTYGIAVSDNNGSGYSTDPYQFMSVSIDHNDISSTDNGILSSASNSIIDHNTISAAYSGITIIGNSTNTPTGMMIDSNIVSMAANSPSHGILLGGVDYPTVHNNKIFWASTGTTTGNACGISVASCTRPVVRDNEIAWAPLHGIQFSSSSDVRCQGNDIHNVSAIGTVLGNGIHWISGGKLGQNFIVSNNIVDDRSTTLMNYPFNNATAGDGHLHLKNNTFYAVTRSVDFHGAPPVEVLNASPPPTGAVGVKVAVPATATSPGVVGQWAADANYHYDCIAPNRWVRSAAAAW